MCIKMTSLRALQVVSALACVILLSVGGAVAQPVPADCDVCKTGGSDINSQAACLYVVGLNDANPDDPVFLDLFDSVVQCCGNSQNPNNQASCICENPEPISPFLNQPPDCPTN